MHKQFNPHIQSLRGFAMMRIGPRMTDEEKRIFTNPSEGRGKEYQIPSGKFLPTNGFPKEILDMPEAKKDKAIKDKYEECSLCLGVLREDEDLWRLPCGHAFHTKCIRENANLPSHWNKICPLCKQDIDDEDFLTLTGIPPGQQKIRETDANDLDDYGEPTCGSTDQEYIDYLESSNDGKQFRLRFRLIYGRYMEGMLRAEEFIDTLKSLNLSDLRNLEEVWNVDYDDFSPFRLLPSLKKLQVNNCGLTRLDVTQLNKLEVLECSGNEALEYLKFYTPSTRGENYIVQWECDFSDTTTIQPIIKTDIVRTGTTGITTLMCGGTKFNFNNLQSLQEKYAEGLLRQAFIEQARIRAEQAEQARIMAEQALEEERTRRQGLIRPRSESEQERQPERQRLRLRVSPTVTQRGQQPQQTEQNGLWLRLRSWFP